MGVNKEAQFYKVFKFTIFTIHSCHHTMVTFVFSKSPCTTSKRHVFFFFKIGDKVEAIKTNIGAWFDAEIIDIHPHSKCLCSGKCSCTYKLLFEG